MSNLRSIAVGIGLILSASAAAAQDFPPGWLPVHRLDDRPTWAEVRKIEDKVHLYLPPGVDNLRGVFICYVFHSQDPRELARLWKFGLVTIPWPFEYDLGLNDKRNGRYKLGHPVGNMGILLKYLDAAAAETKHPELAVAPMVGWLGQNGSHLGNDLFKRAPDRVIAWTDSFPNSLAKYPDFTSKVPFAYAWEFTPAVAKERQAERERRLPEVKGMPTPPVDLTCRANTYGFMHGIYSKWTFFMLFLDRLIKARLPENPPPAGQPTVLRPVEREKGWTGDYNPVGEWNPIAPFAEAKGFVAPVWLPDAYCAWGWRAYHTAKPDIKLTAPVVEYRTGGDRKACGLGFDNIMKPGEPLEFAATTTGDYARIEFYSGDRLLGVSEKAPYQLSGVRLERGLHALSAVGVGSNGERRSSRAAFLVVDQPLSRTE